MSHQNHQNHQKRPEPDTRHLPPKGEGRIFGGRGQGRTCALCGSPIDDSQIEYEVEWTDNGITRRSHFHLACYEQLRSQQP